MVDTLTTSNFNFSFQESVYHGKVRDVYYLKNNLVVMVASDRISAFDVVMTRGIPYKGQILNQIAIKMMDETKDLVPNWLIHSPDPNVSVGHLCTPFKVEMVIRGYLSGHAARQYKKGIRKLCGVEMPNGMKENDKAIKDYTFRIKQAPSKLKSLDIQYKDQNRMKFKLLKV